MRKRISGFILALVTVINLIGSFTLITSAETSGECGDNLTWAFYHNTLAIDGSGAMQNYQSEAEVPWHSIRSDITQIIMSDGITSISDYAFSHCHRIEALTIPDSVKSIGNYAFYYCYSLTGIDIPDSTESIGDMAFSECSTLSAVTLGNRLTTLGTKAFSLCNNLTDISVSEDNTVFSSLDGVLMNKDKTKLITYPSGISSSYTVPDSVLSIEDDAFYYCKNLTDITIADNVTDIGDSAFYYCKGLSEIILPDSTEKIGNNVFAHCTNLVNITFGKNLAETGGDIFNSCSSLESISVSEDNTVYSSHDGVLFNKDKTTLLKCPPAKTGEYTIPDGVSVIADSAFMYCFGLEGVSMPKSLEAIENSAFSYCISLSDISVPANIKTISENAFCNCSGITRVYMPVSVTDISVSAFYGCDYIEKVYYGGSESQWNAITIKENNESLTDAEIYFECFDGENIVVSAICVTPESASLSIGETVQLSAECVPEEAVDKSVTWTSSAPLVATVDENGLVTAVADGKAVITATSANGKTAVCRIIVKKSYKDYGYSFTNSNYSFGYAYGYKIPKERYLQLGFSESVADHYASIFVWGGSCFGMSLSSALFYKDNIHEERYDETISVPIKFNRPDSKTDVKEIKLRNMIELMQMSQFLRHRSETFSAQKITSELDNGNPVMLTMDALEGGGHAVIIYDYTKTGDEYYFNIYDCSNFIKGVYYTDSTNYSFDYRNKYYTWRIRNIQDYNSMYGIYNKIVENGCAAELFSQNEPITYIVRPAGDITITNSIGQTSTITDGMLNGDIENISFIPDEYLAENPHFTIIAPKDTYTISGTGEDIIKTVIVDDNMSVEITSKASTPITVSENLYEVNVPNTESSDYSVCYTTYDNAFDKLTLSGTSDGIITTVLDGTDAVVSGADSVSVSVSVGANNALLNVENASEYTDISVKYDDVGNSLQLFGGDTAITEESALPERKQTPVPIYEIITDEASGKEFLSFTKDDDTVIYYTTDTSEPSQSSTLYTMPIEINDNITIKAIASKYGYTDSKAVVINEKEVYIAPPTANYESGSYDDVIYVELLCEEDGGEIRYATSEADLYENDTVYTAPIRLSKDTVIYAYCVKDGYTSEVVTLEYKISLKYPIKVSTIKNQDGEEITTENLSDLTQVKLNADKLCDGNQGAVFIAVFYDKSGNIVSLGINPTVLEADTQEICIDISGNTNNVSEIKILVWDSILGLKPISKAVIQTLT